MMCRYNGLRAVTCIQVGTQNEAFGGAGILLCAKQFQRGAGMEMPYFGGVDTMPMAALVLFQKEKNGGACRARARVSLGHPCLTIPASFWMRR